MPSIDAEQVRALAAQGLGGTEIARRLKIGRASVYRLHGFELARWSQKRPYMASSSTGKVKR